MRSSELGFTLIEMMAVMVIVALIASSLSISVRSTSAGTKAKSTAVSITAGLRGLRSKALATSSERVAVFNLAQSTVSFGNDRSQIAIDPSLSMKLTSAESERVSTRSGGIRFFPNGSSSGGAIQIKAGEQGYVVRVNWLTGRVSIDAP